MRGCLFESCEGIMSWDGAVGGGGDEYKRERWN